jgi:hypothetical protein
MVFNATFNNISAKLWQSVLLMEETVLPGENHRPVASHWQTLSHNVSSTPRLNWIWIYNISGDRHWLEFIVYKSVHIINYQTTFIILDKILDVLFLYTTKFFIFSATGKIQKSSVLWGERLCFWDWEETKTY